MSLLKLPKKGKAMVVTDIHGNLTDFEKLLEIWKKFKDKDKQNHLILTGDYIHSRSKTKDNSIKILDSVKWHYEHCKNFHVLPGNHEWSHILDLDIYKSGVNQTQEFKLKLQDKFNQTWMHKLDLYVNFFKKLPLAVKTKNGVFISHAAPARNINDIDDIINITAAGYGTNNKNLFELLWNRYQRDYDERDIEIFLEKVACKVSVVGHTPVDCYEIIGKQLILSSSFGPGKKCYLELDLEKDITDVDDLIGMIKHLEK